MTRGIPYFSFRVGVNPIALWSFLSNTRLLQGRWPLISFQLTFVYDCTSWVYKYLSAQKQPIRIITNDIITITQFFSSTVCWQGTLCILLSTPKLLILYTVLEGPPQWKGGTQHWLQIFCTHSADLQFTLTDNCCSPSVLLAVSVEVSDW